MRFFTLSNSNLKCEVTNRVVVYCRSMLRPQTFRRRVEWRNHWCRRCPYNCTCQNDSRSVSVDRRLHRISRDHYSSRRPTAGMSRIRLPAATRRSRALIGLMRPLATTVRSTRRTWPTYTCIPSKRRRPRCSNISFHLQKRCIKLYRNDTLLEVTTHVTFIGRPFRMNNHLTQAPPTLATKLRKSLRTLRYMLQSYSLHIHSDILETV